MSLSYASLNEQANRLAHHLLAIGIRRGELVGISVERSPEMIVGLIGILKAGAAYLPLDPDYPDDRRGFMLSDSGARVVLTQSPYRDRFASFAGTVLYTEEWSELTEGLSSSNPASGAFPPGLAYVCYTSGSTGRPKGAEISHRAVVRLGKNTNYFAFGPDETFLQFAPLAFVTPPPLSLKGIGERQRERHAFSGDPGLSFSEPGEGVFEHPVCGQSVESEQQEHAAIRRSPARSKKESL